eukprot:1194441-Rhodomonas_salina.1
MARKDLRAPSHAALSAPNIMTAQAVSCHAKPLGRGADPSNEVHGVSTLLFPSLIMASHSFPSRS